MPLGLQDLHGNATRAAAGVADLEAELAQRRVEAEAAASEAAAAAKVAEVERVRAEKAGWAQLAELEAKVAEALARPSERPPIGLRSHAREWLYSGADQALKIQQFKELVAADPAAMELRNLSLSAGRLLVFLTSKAGLAEDHRDVLRTDSLECECWSRLLQRIRSIGGEGNNELRQRGTGSGANPIGGAR